jgi:effector-binding domain-containing protein
MIDPPKIVQTKAKDVAVIHVTIPRSEIQQVMGPGLSELRDTLAAQGLAPTGPWFTRHLKLDPKVFDFEIGVPIDKPLKPQGRVRTGQLPAGKVARTIYHGPYEGLHAAWSEFGDWLGAHGHEPRESIWETYLTDPNVSEDPSTYLTELTRPLK